jgi:hypothetical protein
MGETPQFEDMQIFIQVRTNLARI